MTHGGPRLKCLQHSLEEFLVSCVDRYQELVPGFKLRKVATPFLPEPPPPVKAAIIPAWDLTLARDVAAPSDVGQLQPIAA